MRMAVACRLSDRLMITRARSEGSRNNLRSVFFSRISFVETKITGEAGAAVRRRTGQEANKRRPAPIKSRPPILVTDASQCCRTTSPRAA